MNHYTLTYAETISAMFMLAILVAVWAIYSEVRTYVAKSSGKQKEPTKSE